MLKGESSDIPYVQLEELRDGASIDDKIVQLRRQERVKALILLSEKKKFNENLILSEGRSFVVIFVPPNVGRARLDLKSFLEKSSSSSVSVIPMLETGEVVDSATSYLCLPAMHLNLVWYCYSVPI